MSVTIHRLAKLLTQNLVWGTIWGIMVALAFVLFAWVRYIFQGESPFQAHHTTFRRMVMTYLFCGMISGISAGLLRPAARFYIGAIIMGVLISSSVYFPVCVDYVWIDINLD